jgi:DNA modification methylase
MKRLRDMPQSVGAASDSDRQTHQGWLRLRTLWRHRSNVWDYPGQNVFQDFGGAGTTLIAAEKTHRKPD